VLKISTIENEESVALQLDGKVSGRWIELLREICDVQLKKFARIMIDLKNVSFVDRDGITLLKSLANRQVEIRNALPFIAEQIRNSAP